MMTEKLHRQHGHFPLGADASAPTSPTTRATSPHHFIAYVPRKATRHLDMNTPDYSCLRRSAKEWVAPIGQRAS